MVGLAFALWLPPGFFDIQLVCAVVQVQVLVANARR